MSKSFGPILVTGAHGMLGTDLIATLKTQQFEVIETDKTGAGVLLDVTQRGEVFSFFDKFQPQVVVNCAAFTAVDDAESASERAYLINTVGAGNIASAAAEFNTRVIHISTDYVFGVSEMRNQPLREDEKCAPASVYGASKYYAELLLQQLLPTSAVILRTSWLHGIAGPNFIDTMLKLGKERTEISVVDDQVGSPTWTVWLAEVIALFCKRPELHGVFHASSRGGISWNEFAKEIFRQAGLQIDVKPQTTAALGRPAPRPAFSTLDVSKLEAALGIVAPDWKVFVDAHLRARGVVG